MLLYLEGFKKSPIWPNILDVNVFVIYLTHLHGHLIIVLSFTEEAVGSLVFFFSNLASREKGLDTFVLKLYF